MVGRLRGGLTWGVDKGDFLSDGSVLWLDGVVGHMEVTITFILKKTVVTLVSLKSRSEAGLNGQRGRGEGFHEHSALGDVRRYLALRRHLETEANRGSRNECSWGRPETEQQEGQ